MRIGRWTRTCVAAVAALLLAACTAGPGDPSPPPSTDQGSSSPSSPSPSATTPSSPAQTPGPDATPVYWIGDSAQRPWLYREFRSLPEHPNGRVSAAIHALSSVQPDDPDYRSGWSSPMTDVQVTEEEDAITVDLPGPAVAELDVASTEGSATLQQLVWTVTAAAGENVPVTITVDGEAFVDALERDQTIRGQVWVTSPLQGGSLERPVVIEGTSTSFEGTLLYEITADDSVVDSGNTTGGANGDFAEFSIEAGLEPGEYTVAVFGTDASGGESGEGEQPFVDTKDFVVVE